MAYQKVLYVEEGIQKYVNKAEYAVRGELVLKALEYQEMIKRGEKLPFDDLIFCNIGNPLALELLELPHDPEAFSPDVIALAKEIVYAIGTGGLGAYSHSQGIPLFRKWVAEFIQRRDGHSCNPENVFLTDGASPGVKTAMQLLIRSPKDGIMIPIPQYPLYSATIALNGGTMVKYYLEEKSVWGLNIEELERSYEEACSEGIHVRALCVINPGNPTSQCLLEDNMKEIVKFCEKKHLVLMADEVYQENVYTGTWVSFKKVVCDLDSPIELLSFHSVSKGMIGECGLRGGYVELHNIDPHVQAQWYKLSSISLCPNTVGQLVTGLMAADFGGMKKVLDVKFALYNSYKSRATIIKDTLNSLEGVDCQPPMGAMYAFPTIKLSPKAIEAAKEAGKQPDTFYCLRLLAATGICVVPGNGFGQADGTYHFRTTFLPPEDKMDAVSERLKKFHETFWKEYE